MRHPLLSPARSDCETNRVGFEEVAGILINFYGASRTPQLRTKRCRFHCPHFGTKPCKGRNFSASNERGVCSLILRCMGDDECMVLGMLQSGCSVTYISVSAMRVTHSSTSTLWPTLCISEPPVNKQPFVCSNTHSFGCNRSLECGVLWVVT